MTKEQSQRDGLQGLDKGPGPGQQQGLWSSLVAAERAQFDGDVPQARSGPLAGNATPAVPVLTDSADPVQIGMMLHDASESTKAHLLDLRRQWQEMVEGSTGTDLAISDQAPEPAGYQTGKEAEMVPVQAKPSTLGLSSADRQKYTWATISTSQGRRSALLQIGLLVSDSLRAAGLDCPVREFRPNNKGNVLAQAAWTYHLTGKADLQGGFSFLTVAAAAMAKELRSKKASGWLEVTTVDMVDIRTVGWACRIVE